MPIEYIRVEQHDHGTDDDKGKRDGRIVRYTDFFAYFGMFLHGDSIMERPPLLKRFCVYTAFKRKFNRNARENFRIRTYPLGLIDFFKFLKILDKSYWINGENSVYYKHG